MHLSSIGAHTDKGNGLLAFHYNVENILQTLPSDVSITFMRPIGFYYNLLGFINTIKTQGVIATNYGGDSKKPWVSPIDIAAAVAEELVTPFEGSKVRYVASDEISCNELASLLGTAIGKPDLKWVVIQDEQLLKGMLSAGMNPKVAAGLVEINASTNTGDLYEDYFRNKPTLGKVKLAIEKGIETFGQIDVVLNNAGYYSLGSVEEISDEEFRKTSNVNLFSMANVIRQAMPYLRKQQSGHIINISSNMGYIGYTNTGSYNASKFAVIGLSEALAQEAKPFGIHVTVVAPGMFRTNFMSNTTLAVAQNRIAGYGLEEHKKMLQSFDGNQPGDPKKLAKVLFDISNLAEPPLHLPLEQTVINPSSTSEKKKP